MMFRIDSMGSAPGKARLTARDVLTADDFIAIGASLGTTGFVARKTGFIMARQAVLAEPISTTWNGIESEDIAAPGDFIVTNLTADKKMIRDASGSANIYVIRADKFASLYELAVSSGPRSIYRARGTVQALFLAAGFDIAAPWGERQVGSVGYLLRNGDDIYGNHKDTFEATYEQVI